MRKKIQNVIVSEHQPFETGERKDSRRVEEKGKNMS
jgi:hypothetical protein